MCWIWGVAVRIVRAVRIGNYSRTHPALSSSLITVYMNELLAHLVGDYLIQSHWMATEKVKRWLPAILHGLTYVIPFVFLTHSLISLVIIGGTHIIIDRFRLAHYVAKIKNWNWKTSNGYPEETPAWLTVWLMIIADNTIHLLINHLALTR